MSQEELLMRFSESASPSPPPPPEACSSLSSSVTSETLTQNDNNNSEQTKINKDSTQERCKERLKANEENSASLHRTSDNGPTMTTSETSKNEPSVEQVCEGQGVTSVSVTADNSEEFVVHTLCTYVQNDNNDNVKCGKKSGKSKEKRNDACEKCNMELYESNEQHDIPRKKIALISPAVNDELTEVESATSPNQHFINLTTTTIAETANNTDHTNNESSENGSNTIRKKTRLSERFLCPPTPSPPRQSVRSDDNTNYNNTHCDDSCNNICQCELFLTQCEREEMRNVQNKYAQCTRPPSLLSPPLQPRSPLPTFHHHHHHHHHNETSECVLTCKSSNTNEYNGSRAQSRYRKKVYIRRRRKGQSKSEEQQQLLKEHTEIVVNRGEQVELVMSRSLSPLPRCSSATTPLVKRRAASAKASLTVRENKNMHTKQQKNVEVHDSDYKINNEEFQTKMQAMQELNSQLKHKLSALQKRETENITKFEESERERCELRLQIRRLHDMFANWYSITHNMCSQDNSQSIIKTQSGKKASTIASTEKECTDTIDKVMEQFSEVHNNLVAELVKTKLLAVQQQAILDRFDIYYPFPSELTDAAFIATRCALRPMEEHKIADGIGQNEDSSGRKGDESRKTSKVIKNVIERKLKQRNENANVCANKLKITKQDASNVVLHHKQNKLAETLPARAATAEVSQANLDSNKENI